MNLIDLDILILKFFNRPFSPFLNFLFLVIIYFIYGYLVLLLYILFKKGQKDKIVHLIFIMIIGTLLVNILKFSIARPRPYETCEDINKILIKLDPSFPSAHVFTSFICLYFIPKKTSKLFKIFSLIYLLLLIPLGSIYTGIHFPSDVIGGAIIGVILPKIVSQKFANKLFQRIFK